MMERNIVPITSPAGTSYDNLRVIVVGDFTAVSVLSVFGESASICLSRPITRIVQLPLMHTGKKALQRLAPLLRLIRPPARIDNTTLTSADANLSRRAFGV